ncbi:MAG: helix-turn-helix domain-containing protein [Bacteroidota bacterium]
MVYLKSSMVLVAVGNRIREIRKKKNLTQSAVANKAGIAISQVGRIERGKLNPSISTLFVISLAMKIEIKDLFEFDEPFLKSTKKHNSSR